MGGGADGDGRLNLGPLGVPPSRGGPMSERQEGRGSLCPRGLGSLRFDGLLDGFVPASAWPK